MMDHTTHSCIKINAISDALTVNNLDLQFGKGKSYLKSIILWHVTPCTLAEVHRRFGKISVDVSRTIRRYISQVLFTATAVRTSNKKYLIFTRIVYGRSTNRMQ
jgi:hypothetical protein